MNSLYCALALLLIAFQSDCSAPATKKTKHSSDNSLAHAAENQPSASTSGEIGPTASPTDQPLLRKSRKNFKTLTIIPIEPLLNSPEPIPVTHELNAPLPIALEHMFAQPLHTKYSSEDFIVAINVIDIIAKKHSIGVQDIARIVNKHPQSRFLDYNNVQELIYKLTPIEMQQARQPENLQAAPKKKTLFNSSNRETLVSIWKSIPTDHLALENKKLLDDFINKTLSTQTDEPCLSQAEKDAQLIRDLFLKTYQYNNHVGYQQLIESEKAQAAVASTVENDSE